MRCRVAWLIEDWDMRNIHGLREHEAVRKLKDRELLMAINACGDKITFVTSQGHVVRCYAPQRQMYDLAALQASFKLGLGIDLDLGKSEAKLAEAA